jgi:hypothetical protein
MRIAARFKIGAWSRDDAEMVVSAGRITPR